MSFFWAYQKCGSRLSVSASFGDVVVIVIVMRGKQRYRWEFDKMMKITGLMIM